MWVPSARSKPISTSASMPHRPASLTVLPTPLNALVARKPGLGNTSVSGAGGVGLVELGRGGVGRRGLTCGEFLLEGVVQDLDVVESGLERLGCNDAAVLCIGTSTD